jgi:hypothetical protein
MITIANGAVKKLRCRCSRGIKLNPGHLRVRGGMKVVIDKIPVVDENWCGGGYCDGKVVFIDSKIPYSKRRLVLIHEILKHHLKGRVKHSKFDKIALDIIEGLDFMSRKTLDNEGKADWK